MDSLVDIGLRNAVFAVPFAVAALLAGRFVRRPALTHALWLLVLVRLLLPPLWSVAVPKPAALHDAPVLAAATPAVEPATEPTVEAPAMATEPPAEALPPSEPTATSTAPVAAPDADAAPEPATVSVPEA